MPSVRITNYTSSVLNISLKQICAIHFENEVQPGCTIKLVSGKVWFTIEAQVDDGKNRYSLVQSAMTIGLISIAAVATVAAAGAPLISTAAGTAIGGAAAAVGSTLVAGLANVAHVSHGFIVANAGTAAKISAAVLPRALDAVQKEIGGFTEVQKEVVAVITSPSVAEDLRKSGFSTLERFRKAHSSDRKKSKEGKEKDAVEKEGWNVVDGGSATSLPGTLSDTQTVRAHGVSTWDRRVFEIREKDGKMQLFDAVAMAPV
jgi:hypothetical protein